MDKIIKIGSYNPNGFCNGQILDKRGICGTICYFKGAEPAITVNDETLTDNERLFEINTYLKLRNERKLMERDKKKLRIRKLTPLEVMRLMGFDDEDYYKIKDVNSECQIFKQCGNSIVVNCLEGIFKNLLF